MRLIFAKARTGRSAWRASGCRRLHPRGDPDRSDPPGSCRVVREARPLQLLKRDRIGRRWNLHAKHVGAERHVDLDLRQRELSDRIPTAAPTRSSANRYAAGRSGSRGTPRASRAERRRDGPTRRAATAPTRCRDAGSVVAGAPPVATRQSGRRADARCPDRPRPRAAGERRACRSAAPSGTPATASSTSSGGPCSSTRSIARQQQRGVVVPVAAKMKTGCAERRDRLEPGRRRRGQARRAAGRAAGSPPTDPLTAISAVKVRMPRQARVACARTSAASGAGAPRSGRQLHQRRAARRRHDRDHRHERSRWAHRRARRHFFGSFCFAARIFLSMSAAIDRVAVAAERARPGGNRLVVALQLEQHLAVVLLDRPSWSSADRRRAAGCRRRDRACRP